MARIHLALKHFLPFLLLLALGFVSLPPESPWPSWRCDAGTRTGAHPLCRLSQSWRVSRPPFRRHGAGQPGIAHHHRALQPTGEGLLRRAGRKAARPVRLRPGQLLSPTIISSTAACRAAISRPSRGRLLLRSAQRLYDQLMELRYPHWKMSTPLIFKRRPGYPHGARAGRRRRRFIGAVNTATVERALKESPGRPGRRLPGLGSPPARLAAPGLDPR
jgi:hypothetical protein